MRAYRLLTKYDISVEQFQAVWESQGGVCAICNGPPTKGKRLAVDHNHQTGEVRGLLCCNCNMGLGNLKDDIDLLRSAISYLTNPPAVHVVVGDGSKDWPTTTGPASDVVTTS